MLPKIFEIFRMLHDYHVTKDSLLRLALSNPIPFYQKPKIIFSELLRGVDYMSKSLIDKWRLHACNEFSEFSVGEGEDGECAWKDGSKKRIRKFQRYYKKVIQMIEKLSRKSHLRW